MTEPMPGGRRRIDRVLAGGYLDDLRSLPLDEVRRRRHEAEQEEADLSYLRRMLQGRLDLVAAELAGRRGTGSGVGGAGDDAELVSRLTSVLAEPRRHTHGLGRHLTVEPSRVDEHRRRVEQLVADIGMSDVTARSEQELVGARERLQQFEREVSATRQRVQAVMDALTAEVARRYKDGVANVEDLLRRG